MKKVTILLTKYSDWVSQLVYCLCGHGYTHASLGLGDEPDTYYSFNYRGFCTETTEKHRRRGVTVSQSYELSVSDDAYERIQARIEEFRRRKSELHYSRLGVVFCVLHIPFKRKNHYFCSQFVAETLQCADVLPQKKRASLYLPNSFRKELPASKRLLRICANPI